MKGYLLGIINLILLRMRKSLEEKIIDILSNQHDISDGHCGLTAREVAETLDLEFDDIRDALNNLYDNGKIDVRRGINNRLLFIK